LARLFGFINKLSSAQISIFVASLNDASYDTISFVVMMSIQNEVLALQFKAAIRSTAVAGGDGKDEESGSVVIRRLQELLSQHVHVPDAVLRFALFQAAARQRQGHTGSSSSSSSSSVEEACRLLWTRMSPRGKQEYFASKQTVSNCRYSLHEAVRSGNCEMVRLFLEEFKFNVNQKDNVENTPLCYAAISSNEEMSRLLLEAGAHVNRGGKPPMYGLPEVGPLWLAVRHGTATPAMARLLLQHGADFNWNYWSRPGCNDDSAIYLRTTDLAIQNGYAEILALLLEHGAIVGNHFGECATSLNILLCAAPVASPTRTSTSQQEVKLAVCRLLVEHAERDCKFHVLFIKISFEFAMKAGVIEHCTLLLDAGLNRMAAMHWAVRAGNEALCRVLVRQYQVDPFASQESNDERASAMIGVENCVRASASSPFLAAARLPDTAILRFFLQLWDERYSSSAATSSPAGRNDKGEYLIHVLCRDKHVCLQALELLIGEECDQADTLIIASNNAKEEHFLPLVSAAMSDANLDIIFYLLQQCPDALDSALLTETSTKSDEDKPHL
jgi:ankyrin repeat protein